MKTYKVTVNGTAYEITLEDISGQVSSTPAVAPVAATPVATGGEQVTSPMPGTILSVNVSIGDKVKKGQVLMVLEAMKMENEIMCPRDGVLASISVSKGATVDSGAQLCVIQ